MPVLGVVIVLEDASPATRARVAVGLPGVPGIEPGEPSAHRWPAVLEAGSEAAVEERVEAVRGLPGVAGVDVVYADFEDLLSSAPEERAAEGT